MIENGAKLMHFMLFLVKFHCFKKGEKLREKIKLNRRKPSTIVPILETWDLIQRLFKFLSCSYQTFSIRKLLIEVYALTVIIKKK